MLPGIWFHFFLDRCSSFQSWIFFLISVAGFSMSSVSGCRLNGSLGVERICLSIFFRSHTFPEGSRTGSSIISPMIAHSNSCGTFSHSSSCLIFSTTILLARSPSWRNRCTSCSRRPRTDSIRMAVSLNVVSLNDRCNQMFSNCPMQ